MSVTLLESLKRVDGVLGCAAFDASGAVLAEEITPPYNQSMLAEAAESLREAFEVFTASSDTPAPTNLLLRGADGQLVVRNTDGVLVLGVAELRANLAMVNLAMNMVTTKLKAAAGAGTLKPAAPKPSFEARQSAQVLSPDEMRRSTVGRVVLKQVLTALQQRMGPAAKVVLHRALVKQGATASTLLRSQYARLIEDTAQAIPPGLKRSTFVSEVGGLITE